MTSYFYNSLFAKVFATGCSLINGVLALKLFGIYLSPAEFGIFIVAAQVLAYVPFLDGGVRTVTNRELLAAPGGPDRERLLRFSQKFYSWFAVAALAVVMVFMLIYWSRPSVRASGVPLVFFLSLGFAAAGLAASSAQGGLLVGLQSQHLVHWVTGFSMLLNLGVLALAFHLGAGLWAFPIAQGAMFLGAWPAYLFFLKGKLPGFPLFDFRLDSWFWGELRQVSRNAWDSFRSQISILLLFTLDVVIVGAIGTFEEAALYALLIRVFTILRTFIQSLGEVGWPMMAQKREAGAQWSRVLLRVNACLYGSAAGACAACLLPFLAWYMGREWTASPLLFGLVLVRFVVTGLQSPAGYYLIGMGRFRELARGIQREVMAAILLSLVLAPWGAAGVAAGFLLATAAGTLYPILRSYAEAAGFEVGSIVSAVWGRAIASAAVSSAVCWALLPLASGPWIIAAAGCGGAAGIALPVALSYLKLRRLRPAQPLAFDIKQLVSHF